MLSRGTDDTTVAENGDLDSTDSSSQRPEKWALVLSWSRDEPWRIGQVLFLADEPSETTWVGRGERAARRPAKASFGEQRPGSWQPSPPLLSPALSRYQLAFRTVDGGCVVENTGKVPLLRNGVETRESRLEAGDVLQLGRQIVCLFCRRPRTLSAGGEHYPVFAFGQADPNGLVGESSAMWQLRQSILQVAARPDHVLLTGASGTGKDLVARAIHASAGLPPARLVVRNAATLPGALIDAELFGNSRNYPNPGMGERPGLIGEAHEGTLFLDEFAELPQELQTHLLSVLDRGEYQRLGEARTRVSSFRLVAATNRSLSSLRLDLLARFPFQIALPDLDARLEDIPLLVRHFLRRVAARGDRAALELFPSRDPRSEPDVPASWIPRLLVRSYPRNVRELEALLWQALLSPAKEIPDDGASPPAAAEADAPGAGDETPGEAATIQQCLEANDGSIERTWRALGLSSRFALMRLIKKHGIQVRRRPR